MSRGIRNNNPLNIEHGQPWIGLAPVQDDPRFCTFINAKYCYRAATIILQGYELRGVHTVEQIISTWAPSSENDVAAYVADVCRRSGFKPNDGVDLTFPADVIALLQAMTWHENGSCPYDAETIAAGVQLSGVQS